MKILLRITLSRQSRKTILTKDFKSLRFTYSFAGVCVTGSEPGMGLTGGDETQSVPLRRSWTRLGAGQVNKTKEQHIALAQPDAGMACGFLGRERLHSLSWVLKEKLIKQIRVRRKEE